MILFLVVVWNGECLEPELFIRADPATTQWQLYQLHVGRWINTRDGWQKEKKEKEIALE